MTVTWGSTTATTARSSSSGACSRSGAAVVLAALGALAAIAVAGCSASAGAPIDGRDVERSIDGTVAADLRDFDPRLKLSPARCPDRIDLSSGKPATCTFEVDGVPVPVAVTYAAPPNRYHVEMPGYFYERGVIERLSASRADDALGGHHIAHCRIPAFAVMTSGTSFTCDITGGPKPMSIAMRTADKGQVDFGPLPGGAVSETAAERAVYAEHAAGKRTIVAGPTVASMIDRILGEMMQSEPSKPTVVGHAHCPPALDLTGVRTAQCYVEVGGQRLREVVSIRGSGYHMEPLDALVDMRRVEQTQQQSIDATLASRGSQQRVLVKCPGALRVEPAPGDFTCDALVGAQRAELVVHVVDTRGDVQSKLVFPGSPPPP